MANLTISADEEVLRRLRIEAATTQLSVSRYVGQVLADKFRADDTYTEAMAELFSRQPYLQLNHGDNECVMPTRSDIYDRPILR